MKCGYCAYEFDPAAAEAACAGCPLTRGCHLVRCPHCGYETPPESKLIGWLRRWGARIKRSSMRRDLVCGPKALTADHSSDKA